MALDFHHLFIFTPPGAAIVDRLIADGFVEGSANRHPGQGTANRRLFFENGMLEFLWVADPAEATSSVTAPTRLWERSRGDGGHSPYGLALSGHVEGPAAFPGWAYQPAYLPPGAQLWMGEGHPWEPLIFLMPNALSGPSPRPEPRTHANGVRRIAGIAFGLAGPIEAASPAMRVAEGLPLVSVHASDAPSLEIRLEGSEVRDLDFTPDCPLRITVRPAE